MDVSAVDGEALWDELAGGTTAGESVGTPAGGARSAAGDTASPSATESAGAAAEPSVEPGTDRGASGSDRETLGSDPLGGTSREASAEHDEAVVDKRQYCQQCPYFSEPPEVACSHDGTTIVEVLMDGQFRVRGCPVVTDSGPDRTMLNDGS